MAANSLLICPNDSLVFGIDEAGRGSLITCVVAAAVLIDSDIPLHKSLNDSKKVSPRNREIVKDWIEENCLHGIGIASETEIDAMNIRQATFLAMHRAIENVGVSPDHLLIDGDCFKPYKLEGNVIPHTLVPQGDSKYASIAAASILAKQHRDSLVLQLADENPVLKERYRIDSNMGYGSEFHMTAIRTHGPSRFHRKSFAPSKDWISKSSGSFE